MLNIIIFVLLIIFIFYLYKYQTISFLNSHFGSNLTTEEADRDGNKKINFISKIYNKIILNCNKNYNGKECNSSAPPTISVDELTKEKFYKLTNNLTTPVIVKGFVRNSNAVQKWNLEYFSNKYGDLELPLIEKADINDVKDNSKYIKDYKYTKLSEIIKDIKLEKPVYVNNVSRIFGFYPELIDDMELDNIKDKIGIDLKNSNEVNHMFLGGKSTGTTLHASYIGNFFFNIKGIKKWYLIHPKYSNILLPTLSRTGLFAVSKVDIFHKNDLTNRIPRYEFELNEGDLLFNPPWWWHAVKNQTDYTIGCANRYANFKSAMQNNPLYTTIFYSHPIENLKFAFSGKDKQEANKNNDKILLKDILRQDEKI